MYVCMYEWMMYVLHCWILDSPRREQSLVITEVHCLRTILIHSLGAIHEDIMYNMIDRVWTGYISDRCMWSAASENVNYTRWRCVS